MASSRIRLWLSRSCWNRGRSRRPASVPCRPFSEPFLGGRVFARLPDRTRFVLEPPAQILVPWRLVILLNVLAGPGGATLTHFHFGLSR